MTDIPHKQATQADVARKAGVHRSTVSLALHGSAKIPEPTRAKICAAASELGYEPDPMLSALAYYRNSRRKKAYHGTLAWLVNAADDRDWAGEWHVVTQYKDMYLGARGRAPTHGYNLEVFEINTKKFSPQRTAGILRSRNITGLLVCPQPRPNTELDFPWEGFSAVTFGYTLARPQLHRVTTAHFRSMWQMMRMIRSLGYRRIGLVYSKNVDIRVSHHYLAAYLADCQLYAPDGPLIPVDPGEEDFGKWFCRARPDAIVSAGLADIGAVLRRAGLRAPDDVGVAVLPLDTPPGTLAGIYESCRDIGECAVDMLVALVQQGARGCPEMPRHTLIDGVWSPGKSLPQRMTKEKKRR
jgi:LacI family transcriptional regulator/LacI family repressor for deo operon, udp, cdd, tsx, nupC, and nupG